MNLGLMKPLALVGGMFLSDSSLAAESQQYVPDTQTLSHLESKITLPDDAIAPLSDYTRYYFGIIVGGRRGISGDLVLGHAKKGIHIIRSDDEFPGITDGGCIIVHLMYDVQLEKITTIFCNPRR